MTNRQPCYYCRSEVASDALICPYCRCRFPSEEQLHEVAAKWLRDGSDIKAIKRIREVLPYEIKEAHGIVHSWKESSRRW